MNTDFPDKRGSVRKIRSFCPLPSSCSLASAAFFVRLIPFFTRLVRRQPALVPIGLKFFLTFLIVFSNFAFCVDKIFCKRMPLCRFQNLLNELITARRNRGHRRDKKMKTLKVWSMLVCLLAISAGFVSCSDDDEGFDTSLLIGRWELVRTEGFFTRPMENAFLTKNLSTANTPSSLKTVPLISMATPAVGARRAIA